MKRILNTLFLVILFNPFICFSQEQEIKVKEFNKLVVSPIIDVELIKGEEESVRIVAEDVSLDKINVKNTGKTLRIFLDHARWNKKYEKVHHPDDPHVIISRSRYEGARVKAYVTYTSLERIQIRGDGDFLCNSRLGSEKLKVKFYGEVDARIASVDAKRFRLSVYGDNKVRIGGGAVDRQVYKMFGENKIYSTKVNSTTAKVSVFGDGNVRLSTDQALKLSSFGDSEVYYKGKPTITKAIVLGELTVRPY